MKKLNLEIDGERREYNIPDSWKDVTVEQYSKIYSLNKEELTDIETSVRCISILTGVEEDMIYDMSPKEFGEISKLVDFTHTEIDSEVKDSIIVEGEEYFLKKDFDKLTMGEVISLELIIEKSKGLAAGMMSEMLCIFLRKKDENGELEKFRKNFMERAEMFNKVSIADVNDVFLFFSDGGSSFVNNMKGSLEKEKISQKIEEDSQT